MFCGWRKTQKTDSLGVFRGSKSPFVMHGIFSEWKFCFLTFLRKIRILWILLFPDLPALINILAFFSAKILWWKWNWKLVLCRGTTFDFRNIIPSLASSIVRLIQFRSKLIERSVAGEPSVAIIIPQEQDTIFTPSSATLNSKWEEPPASKPEKTSRILWEVYIQCSQRSTTRKSRICSCTTPRKMGWRNYSPTKLGKTPS